MDSPRRATPVLGSPKSSENQLKKHSPALQEDPLPNHPGYLVLPSAYLRPLHAIRKAGGAVVWLDLVTKVNKVKRQQQRLVIITQTHLYSCLPDEGDIQRCLPLSMITSAHLHVPASAAFASSRRSKSVFGSSAASSGYGGSSYSASRDDSGRVKCEVLLTCPSEYDILFFVNDNTFQHFVKALTAPQDPMTMGSMAATSFSNSFAAGSAGSFAGHSNSGNATNNQSFAASQSFGVTSSTGGTVAPPAPNGVNAAGAAVYTVPIIEVPQPLLQTPSLTAKARLEKPAKYNRTKAARFVTVFPKLIAPPEFDAQSGQDEFEDSFSQTANSDKGSIAINKGATSISDTADMHLGGSSGKLASRSASITETRKRSDSPTAEILDDISLQRRAARQRAISVHIPLPDEREKAAQDKKVAAAKIEAASTMAGPVAVATSGDIAAADDEDPKTPSAGPKPPISISDIDSDSEVPTGATSQKGQQESSRQSPGKYDRQVEEDDGDDLLAEMDRSKRERESQRARGPAPQQADSPQSPAGQGFTSPQRSQSTIVPQTRWASLSGPLPVHTASSAPGLGSREGWLGVLKAHKTQNDALRKIIAELQIQVSTLSRENVALRSSTTAAASSATEAHENKGTLRDQIETASSAPLGGHREVDMGEL